LSGSTITARALCCSTLLLTLLVSGCGPNQVVVKGNFPEPLVTPLPITLGVYYDPEFRNHEFFDESKSRTESDWIVRTGQAQTQMYDTLLPAMFNKVVMLNELPRDQRIEAVGEASVQAVLVPHVEELQYTTPRQTKVKVFEIWLRYRYELYSPDGQLLADWTMTSYGKTPTAFLQTAEAAVNQAAVMALRDAGANFLTNFENVPEVKLWLESLNDPAPVPVATPSEEAGS
jgi:hypothetical protein